jgi:hypothetical protein
MSNSRRLLFACAGVAASLALAATDGRAQQQPPATSAQGPEPIRLVYGPTGRPAAGLRVTIDGRGKYYEALTGPDGIAQIALDGARLRVTDPQSGLLLVATFTFDRGKDVLVPLAVRITGTATGFGASPRIRIGSGHPIDAVDFQRRETMQSGFDPRVELHGLQLPRIAENWSDVAAESDGRFTSPWVELWASAQLVIAGPDGTLLREVPLPADMAEARTLDIGEQRPQFSSTLEVAADVTTPPHALQIRTQGLRTWPDQGEQTALNVVLLNALDIRIGLFLLGRGSLPLGADAPTRVTVPPLASLDLLIESITPGVDLPRPVSVPPDGKTSVRLTSGELLGETAPRAPLRGQVRIDGTGPPVAGARVLYSSHPHQFTATTDRRGMFTIPRAFADRPAALSIETPTGRAPPRHRAHVHHMLAAAAPGATQGGGAPRVFAAPSAPRQSPNVRLGEDLLGNGYGFCKGAYTQDEQYQYGPLVFLLDGNGNAVSDSIFLQGVDSSGVASVSVIFSKAGTYVVGAQYTPYITASTGVTVSQPGFQLFYLQPTNLQLSKTIVFMNKSAGPTPNAEVFFPSWEQAASPYIATVQFNSGNQTAFVVMQCFNYLRDSNGIPIYAFDPSYGTYEGSVTPNTNYIQLSTK